MILTTPQLPGLIVTGAVPHIAYAELDGLCLYSDSPLHVTCLTTDIYMPKGKIGYSIDIKDSIDTIINQQFKYIKSHLGKNSYVVSSYKIFWCIHDYLDHPDSRRLEAIYKTIENLTSEKLGTKRLIPS